MLVSILQLGSIFSFTIPWPMFTKVKGNCQLIDKSYVRFVTLYRINHSQGLYLIVLDNV